MKILKRILYSCALSAALITMVICMLAHVSPFVILFRGAIVFLGVLVIFFIGANLMRWAVIMLTPKVEPQQEKK